ncbi:MAG: hypothetical protein V1767_00690 [Chloroflexota bacterium]
MKESKIEQLRQAYKVILTEKVNTDPEYNWPDKSEASIDDCINKMFKAVARSGRSDWLKYNSALKVACKNVGIKKSSELRELFKGFEITDNPTKQEAQF